ncbi:MAG TPA: ribonuclease HII [Blastocatellia bacterium]|nr:ribonuclease HII [Blastocatellia bacterium]
MKQHAARPPGPSLAFEREGWNTGFRVVAGVDEAGRGALAGPVVAAAVVLEPERIPDGIDDSKRLSRRQRERLYDQIVGSVSAYCVARIEPDVIDRINILQASLLAMRQALSNLGVAADHVLVDGNVAIPEWTGSQRTLVDGDARSLSIAAASILAKVTRDRVMRDYDAEWPEFGFASHVGYGTRAHMLALERFGPSPIHRRTFRGVLNGELFPDID